MGGLGSGIWCHPVGRKDTVINPVLEITLLLVDESLRLAFHPLDAPLKLLLESIGSGILVLAKPLTSSAFARLWIVGKGFVGEYVKFRRGFMVSRLLARAFVEDLVTMHVDTKSQILLEHQWLWSSGSVLEIAII